MAGPADPIGNQEAGRHNSSASTGKRRARVTQACDPCRESRRKCDAGLPSCHSCTAQHIQCSRSRRPKKRGKPTGYIWALEVTLGMLLTEHPAIAESVRQLMQSDGGSSSSASSPEQHNDDDHDEYGSRRISVHNEPLMRSYYAAWHRGEALGDIEKMLERTDRPLINYRPRRKQVTAAQGWEMDHAQWFGLEGVDMSMLEALEANDASQGPLFSC
ncbi:hypothetical protein F5X68DRAFT_230503 [Plectosphaerella plurivora]|uniref:Zn(2)-C6 fungal-type domain-containing protein n=1 Tax=Plectosphaerella plurivora TaxID=936078 RepID=A0A9P9ACV7_9PEZI|nr:hypothetical protein F5X68DRAFT_230503 [Plectosphaerella plurivora]